MITKNKKKILPIGIVSLLIISVLSGFAIGDNPHGTTFVYDDTPLYEKGSWNVSEHIRDGSLDELWTAYAHPPGGVVWEVNDTVWNLDEFASYAFNYSFMWNNSTGAAGDHAFSWAICNSSYMNRSQSVVFTRVQNETPLTGGCYVGVIFASNTAGEDSDADNMTCVLYGPHECYLLNFNNTTQKLYDVKNGTEVFDNSTAKLTNYYHQWIDDESFYDYNFAGFYNGTWIKTIYNPKCSYVQSKYWGNSSNGMLGFLDEPTGWVVEETAENLYNDKRAAYGLCVWNPGGSKCVAQFDMLDVWKLNYTLNDTSTFDGLNVPRHHWDFPLVNASDVNTTMMDLLWEAVSGNVTMNNISDFWIDLTNRMSLESRAYHPDETAGPSTLWKLQNDTIYYHGCVFTDFNEFADYWFEAGNPFTGNPDDVLFMYIHDCPQSGVDPTTILFTAFDLDNDGTYGPTDRAFYYDGGGVEGSWTGLIPDGVTNFEGGIGHVKGVQSYHRYNYFNSYWLMIPIPELTKTSGDMIVENDTFRLLTFSVNQMWDDNMPVLCNWNETNCSSHTGTESYDILKPLFINSPFISHELPLAITDENVARWGEGQVGWASGEEIKGGFIIDVVKSANVSSIPSGFNTTDVHLINYSINITNAGTGSIAEIVINETWHNCSCSPDFNWTFISQSHKTNANWDPWDFATSINRTWNNDSCYMLINMTNITLNATEYFNWSFVVDARVCVDDTMGTMVNWANVTCDQFGVTGSDTHSVRWSVVTALRITALTQVTDVLAIANSVLNILGVVLIIGAIMSIIGLIHTRW